MPLYPKAQMVESGCKVGWRFYKEEADARECSRIAAELGDELEREGYDFGFQVVGNIEPPKSVYNATPYWKVTTP